MKQIILFVAILGMVFLSCADNNNEQSVCNKVIKTTGFINPGDTTLNYTITNAQLHQSCLELTIQANGCDSNLWNVELLTDSIYLESKPLQKILKVELINNQDCEALLTKTVSFDISPIKAENNHILMLNIQGWNGQLEYNY